jgi:hypothetical protein
MTPFVVRSNQTREDANTPFIEATASSAFQTTDSVSAQYLKGHLPLDHIEFASMPEYSPQIRSGDSVIGVIDLTNRTIFGELTKWIKSNLVKERIRRASVTNKK